MTLPKPLSAARLAVAGCCFTLLAACSVLPKSEPIQVWQPVESASVTASTTPSANFSLRVDTPNATGLLDQTGIVVMPKPGKVNTYQGARWSVPPVLLVRDRLVDAFMAAGLPSVTTSSDHFSADYALSGDLRAFQSEYHSGSPEVVVRYDAQLRHQHARQPLASHSFVIKQHPAGAQVPQIVAAFGAADDKLAAQVVTWTLKAVSQHQRQASAHSQSREH